MNIVVKYERKFSSKFSKWVCQYDNLEWVFCQSYYVFCIFEYIIYKFSAGRGNV